MAPPVKVKLLFLPSKTPSTHARKSKHQLELEDQEARAHAASIAHHRAGRGGTQGHKGQRHALQQESTVSRRLLPVMEDDLALQKKQNQRDWNSQGLAWIKTGPLDPFLVLPTDLDIKDRNMLFHCKRAILIVHSLLFSNHSNQISTSLLASSTASRRILYTVQSASAPSSA